MITDVHPDERPQSFILEIEKHCKGYSGSSLSKSLFQLFSTLALFFSVLTFAFLLLQKSWILAVPFIVIAAGLLTRIFIFQHDCGHGSFFSSKSANNWTGRALSLLTFTPYDFWRRAHNMHHATSGDLDRRSIGGIDTITVREYKAMSKKMQTAYRIYRNPLILVLLGTPFYIMIAQRIPFNFQTHFYGDYKTLSNASIFKSIMLTNAALLGVYASIGIALGFNAVFAIYLPVLILTSWIGGWLFYVQHQFEDTYWQKHENWSSRESALHGSSYYEMPKILQWFTGNIGLHHIHHLCAKIPNYRLQDCMDAHPELKQINRITLKDSLKCLHLRLWDEESQRLIGFDKI